MRPLAVGTAVANTSFALNLHRRMRNPEAFVQTMLDRIECAIAVDAFWPNDDSLLDYGIHFHIMRI